MAPRGAGALPLPVGPSLAFRPFASIGGEIPCATRGLKAWRQRGDFIEDFGGNDLGDFRGDIAAICQKLDQGKRIAHQLHARGILNCSWPPGAASGPAFHGNPRSTQVEPNLRSLGT